MKCYDVQDMLWSGTASGDVDTHLHNCTACREEALAIRRVLTAVQDVEIPLPSKSLVPSDAFLKKVERLNRLRRLGRRVAVAACFFIVMGLSGTVWENFKTPTPAHAGLMQQKADTVGNSGTTQPIIVDSQAANREMCLSIERYLENSTNWNEVKHITVLNCYPLQISESEMRGVTSLDVNLVSDATSDYMTGYQDKYVSMTKQNGAWVVTGLQPTHSVSAVTEISPTSKHPELADAVRVYIDNHLDLRAVSGVIVVDVEPLAVSNGGSDQMYGSATLKVAAKDNVQTALPRGITTWRVSFQRENSVWVAVSMVSTS